VVDKSIGVNIKTCFYCKKEIVEGADYWLHPVDRPVYINVYFHRPDCITAVRAMDGGEDQYIQDHAQEVVDLKKDEYDMGTKNTLKGKKKK